MLTFHIDKDLNSKKSEEKKCSQGSNRNLKSNPPKTDGQKGIIFSTSYFRQLRPKW